MHRIWANQPVQFYEAIFEPPQAPITFLRVESSKDVVLQLIVENVDFEMRLYGP